jgi:hypothetical protein
MRTALDAPIETFDESEAAFVARIKEHGWFRTSVLGDEEGPGFSYTTGFWVNAKRPELIMFGLKDEIVHDIFWDAFRDAKAGQSLVLGTPIHDLFGNLPAWVFPVATRHYANFLGWSRWFYAGDDFPCLQIVWPDRTGLFPWQDGFDPAFEADQLDLSEGGWRTSING